MTERLEVHNLAACFAAHRALWEAAGFPLTIPDLALRSADAWELIGNNEPKPALAILRAIETELKALTNGIADRT